MSRVLIFVAGPFSSKGAIIPMRTTITTPTRPDTPLVVERKTRNRRRRSSPPARRPLSPLGSSLVTWLSAVAFGALSMAGQRATIEGGGERVGQGVHRAHE